MLLDPTVAVNPEGAGGDADITATTVEVGEGPKLFLAMTMNEYSVPGQTRFGANVYGELTDVTSIQEPNAGAPGPSAYVYSMSYEVAPSTGAHVTVMPPFEVGTAVTFVGASGAPVAKAANVGAISACAVLVVSAPAEAATVVGGTAVIDGLKVDEAVVGAVVVGEVVVDGAGVVDGAVVVGAVVVGADVDGSASVITGSATELVGSSSVIIGPSEGGSPGSADAHTLACSPNEATTSATATP